MKAKLEGWRKIVYDSPEEESDYQKEWDGIKFRSSPIIEMFHFHRVLIDEGHEIFGGIK